eukprot:6871909-Prymnesium_polylepis.2
MQLTTRALNLPEPQSPNPSFAATMNEAQEHVRQVGLLLPEEHAQRDLAQANGVKCLKAIHAFSKRAYRYKTALPSTNLVDPFLGAAPSSA